MTVSGLKDSEYVNAIVNGRQEPVDTLNIPAGPIATEFRVSDDAGSLEVTADPDRPEVCLETSLVVFREGVAQAVHSARAGRFNCRFEVKTVRPGDYEIALVRLLEEGEAANQAFRSKLGGLAAVKMGPGQHVQTTAKIQTSGHEY